jgi:hypothetical protein
VTVFIGLYAIALVLSIGFFAWSIHFFAMGRRATERKRPSVDVGPDSEPALVALYCQYLVAPQKALVEARQALQNAATGRPYAGRIDSMGDFFEILDLLEVRRSMSRPA